MTKNNFDLDYKKLKIDDGWGGFGGMNGTLIGDSNAIQHYAVEYREKVKDVYKRKNASEKTKKEASNIDFKMQDLFLEGMDLNYLTKDYTIKKEKKVNMFSLSHGRRQFTPHYYYEEKIKYRLDKNGRIIKNYPGISKIKYFFIAEVITYSHLPETFDKDPFSDKNDNFKKLIIDHLNPNKNEWKHLLDLEIPSGRLKICDKSYYRDQWDSLEQARYCNVFETNKKMKVFYVISNRKKLLEDYNIQTSKYDLIDKEKLNYENKTLPNDKIYHGIILY